MPRGAGLQPKGPVRGKCPKEVRASAANAPNVPVLAELDGEDWPGSTLPRFGIAHRATSSHWFLTPVQGFQHPHVQSSAHVAAKFRVMLLLATRGQIPGSGCWSPTSCAHPGVQGCEEPLPPPKPKPVSPEDVWLQGSSCPGSGLPCPCHLLPILRPLQASLMAYGGVVPDGGMSAHIPEEKPRHAGFSPGSLGGDSPAGLPRHQGSPALVGKVTLKINLHDPAGTSAATMPQGANAAAGDVVNQGEEALAVTALRLGGYF